MTNYDCIIVGAGPAGVGCGVVLQMLGLERFCLLERHEVGGSFRRWPAEMRMITPSFPSHGFGILDLNATVDGTSPGHMFDEEHLSGEQYAEYLTRVVEHFNLPVQTNIDVQRIVQLPTDEGFRVETSQGPLTTRFIIWAAGDFQYPRLYPFSGAEHCIHNAQVTSWRDLPGEEHLIIGGYESGIDAAVTLIADGRRVTVIDPHAPWDVDDFDPSVSLSPYTHQRLRRARESGRLQLAGGEAISAVEQCAAGFRVHGVNGTTWTTATPPILATGFESSVSLIADHFDWSEHGFPQLSEDDESTRTPGLFLSGPAVRHGALILCFIYKFRQRYAVIARTIGERLGLDTEPLEVLRAHAMYLDDLTCCDDTCVC